LLSIALVGVTGLVGADVARRLRARSDVALVSYARKPSGAPDERTLNFEKLIYDGSAALDLPPVDVAISCLGTTLKEAGSQGMFRRIDYEYVHAFGMAAKAAGAKHYILMSSVGARRTSSSYYLKVKAEAEAAISRLGFERVDILRPGLLLGKRAPDRRNRRTLETIAQKVAPLADPFLGGALRSYRTIPATVVAAKVVALATGAGKPGVTIHEYDSLIHA
jgi:uncharacterized protein YbjT (DUF2867 family)